MLIWAGILLVLTIFFGFLAFKKQPASPAAKVFFYISLFLFLVALIFGLLQIYFHPEVKIRVEPPLIP